MSALVGSLARHSATGVAHRRSAAAALGPRESRSAHRATRVRANAVSPSTVAVAAVVTAVELPATSLSVKPKKPIKDLDPQGFTDFLAAAGDSLCVVDYYSDWCGPCQLMHKELDKLTHIFKQVKFGKVNCGNCNEFSSRQRIRALPTFRLYYKGTCLDEIIGAKPEKLRALLTHYSVMTSIRK